MPSRLTLSREHLKHEGLGNRHINIRAVLGLCHADAGVGPVVAEQFFLSGRGHVEQLLAAGCGLAVVGVEGEFPIGVGEEHQRVGDGIGGDDEAVAAGQFERDVARRVARGIDAQSIPGSTSAPGLNMADLFLDGGELALRGFDHAFHFLGHLAGEIGRGPEIPFGFGHVERGVGEDAACHRHRGFPSR